MALAQAYSSLRNFEIDQQDQYKVQLFLKKDYSISELKSNLESWGTWQKTEIITSKMAFSLFSKRYGAEMLELLPENPLPASINLWPKKEYQSTYRFSRLLNRLKRQQNVAEIQNSLDSIRFMEEWKSRLSKWGLGILIFLLFVIVVIVRNAVQISLYSRKTLVENMKYIGASKKTILFPFFTESIILALGASLVSHILLKSLYSIIQSSEGVFSNLFKWDDFQTIYVFSFLLVLSIWTSYHSVLKFLKNA
jgi:cell division transport system permease protein